jgi:hypothetical protein
MTKVLLHVVTFTLCGVVVGLVSAAEVRFSASVVRGAGFSRALAGGLHFHLEPVDLGWRLMISECARMHDARCADLSRITLPLRGINARSIEGWHFRNADNSAANSPGEKNVNAPQHERQFQFALNSRELGQFLRQYLGANGAEIRAEPAAPMPTRVGCGRLEITDLAIGNLVAGEKAWIEKMAFSLYVNLNSPLVGARCVEGQSATLEK